MKSLLGKNVYVIGFGTGVVVRESIVNSKVKCTVKSDSIASKGLRAKFKFVKCIPTCKGLQLAKNVCAKVVKNYE